MATTMADGTGAGLGEAWSAATSTQAAPAESLILLTAIAALIVVVMPQTWAIASHAVTAAHDGAHGLVALLSGRRQRGITLHRDTSGRARSHGRTRGLGVIATTAAGYPGPALLGLGAALLLAAGYAAAVLWLALLLLALLLVQIRNAWGIWTVLVMGGMVFAVVWFAGERTQSLVAYAGTWFLLLAAPRSAWELVGQRPGGTRGSDADALGRLTPLPASCWVAGFLAVTVGAAVLGGRALLG